LLIDQDQGASEMPGLLYSTHMLIHRLHTGDEIAIELTPWLHFSFNLQRSVRNKL
jgi:hypothetical protein